MKNLTIFITCIMSCLFLINCENSNKVRTYKILKTTEKKQSRESVFKQNIITFDIPDSWIQIDPTAMRLASFLVPYSDGKGDLSVIKLVGDGGGIQANVNRWRRQLDKSSIELSEIEDAMYFHKGKLGEFKVIEIYNLEKDINFLCAIISTNNQTLFIKLSITKLGLVESKSDFIHFISSIDYN